MSSDPTELLRLILAQQQQLQQKQQRGVGSQELTNQPLWQLYQQLGLAAPTVNAAQPPSSLDALSHLLANYLQGAAGGATNAPAPASNHGIHLLRQALAAQGISQNQNLAQHITSSTPSLSESGSIHPTLNMPRINYASPFVSSHASIHQQQEELIQVAKLLATSKPSLAAAAMEQAFAMEAPSDHEHQFQVQHQQRGTQHQQEQSQDSKVTASSQTRVAATVTSNPFAIKKNESNDALNNSTQLDWTQKSNNVSKESNLAKTQQEKSSASTPTRPQAQSRGKNRVAAAKTKVEVGTKRKPPVTGSSSSIPLSVEPVSLLILQTWNREQLESYVKELQEKNQPIPNTVKIVLEDARKREEKKYAKRMANRKSASTSRARKKQLIDELTAAHATLRRHALILAHLPDPVIVIGTCGEIKFCSAQLERFLKCEMADLLGSNIENFIVPDSRCALRQLIRDLVEAEQHAILELKDGAQQNQVNGAAYDEDRGSVSKGSQDFSNEANLTLRASAQSFPLVEVNVDSVDQMGAEHMVSNSSYDRTYHELTQTTNNQGTMSSSTHDSSLLTAKAGTLEDNDEPPAKKAKSNVVSEKTYSLEPLPCDDPVPRCSSPVNCDGVMGDAITTNNAYAKLSSLIHYDRNTSTQSDVGIKLRTAGAGRHHYLDRKHAVYPWTAVNLSDKQRESPSLSAGSSTPAPIAELNPSEDSVYRDSNESSDDHGQSSSMISADSSSLKKSGMRQHPLAPACNLCFIRRNLTTIWCEVTSSIRTRTRNDEDCQLGIIDHNPRAIAGTESDVSNDEEKELLLCLRPILEGGLVGKEFSFYGKKNETLSKKGNSFSVDVVCPLTITQADGTNHGPIKKRSFSPDEETMSACESSKMTCMGAPEVLNNNIEDE